MEDVKFNKAQMSIGAKLFSVTNLGCEHFIDGYDEAKRNGFKAKKLECYDINKGYNTLYSEFGTYCEGGVDSVIKEFEMWLEKIETGEKYLLDHMEKEIDWTSYNDNMDNEYKFYK